MKKISALVLALVMMVSLAACGQTKKDTPDNSNSSSGVESNTSQTATDGDVTITFWHGYTPQKAEKLDEMIAEYQEENPGVTIQPKFVAEGEEMLTKVQTAVLSNQQPDLLWGYPTWTGPLVSTGKLLPVDDMIGDIQDDISKGLWDVGKYDGKFYSVPIEAGTLLLVYNQDMFDEVGITKAPETWEELEEACEKLTNDERKAISIPFAPNERTTWTWLCFLGQSGGNLLSDDYKEAGFTKEQGLEALEYYTGFYEKGYASITTGTGGSADPFTTGAVAMSLETQGTAKSYIEKFNMNIGVALLPANKDTATALGSNHYFMFDNGDDAKAKATMDFISWMTTGERQADWAISTGYVPVSKSASETELYKNFVAEAPYYAVATQSVQHGVGRPSIEQYPKISDAVSSAIEAIVYGQMDSETGINDIMNAIEKNLK